MSHRGKEIVPDGGTSGGKNMWSEEKRKKKSHFGEGAGIGCAR